MSKKTDLILEKSSDWTMSLKSADTGEVFTSFINSDYKVAYADAFPWTREQHEFVQGMIDARMEAKQDD